MRRDTKHGQWRGARPPTNCGTNRAKRQLVGGQVIVEFALAAVGIVVLAFVTGRVGHWLSESMVLRNANFQGTRLAAASSSPGAGFAGVTPIHLIGPGAGSAGGLPGQPPSAYDRECTVDDALLADAAAWRAEAMSLIQQGAGAWNLDVQNQIEALLAYARWLIEQANALWADKEQVQIWENQITSYENNIRSVYTNHFWAIVEFLNVAGIGSSTQLINAWQEVDDRLGWLAWKIGDLSGLIQWAGGRYDQITSDVAGIDGQMQWAADRINQINQLIWGPGGVEEERQTAINRRNAIDDQLNQDADGPGPATEGVNWYVTLLESQIASLQWGCTPPFTFTCGMISVLNAALEPWKQLQQDLVNERDAWGYWVWGRGVLPNTTVYGLDAQAGRLWQVRMALESERDSKQYCYGGQCANGLANYRNMLNGMKGSLLAKRDTQTYCYDGQCRQGLLNFKLMLEGMRAKYSTEQGWLQQVDSWQGGIEARESWKQGIKNKWCGTVDPHVPDLVADARATCGLQSTCGVMGPVSRYDEGVGPWRLALDPLTGQLNCMAIKLAQRGQEKFDEASNLTQNQLDPNASTRVQELLAEAERLEQEARAACLAAAGGG